METQTLIEWPSIHFFKKIPSKIKIKIKKQPHQERGVGGLLGSFLAR
jgi:hypothetical protein